MKMPPTQIEFIAFGGGLDMVTPPLQMPPGRCREVQNFEVDTLGGYVSSKGYERFDGRAKPSEASYTQLPATVTTALSTGSTVTGSVSGATGVVAHWNNSDVVVTKVVGTFESGENLLVSGSPYAVITGDPQVEGGSSQEVRAQYLSYAADVYRTDIQVVPGNGAIRGVFLYQDVLYAFRNNVGVTACELYKSSPTGWTAVPFGEEVRFTNANVNVGALDTLTQGGVTATVKAVVVETGTLVSGTNTGRLILTSRSGGNFAAGAATTSGSGTLTLSGAQTAIAFNPNGRFRTVTFDFGSGFKVYGCDGVNRAFEFDGETMVPISTGMATDSPSHIAAHKNHLFLTFDNSLQHSAIGNPYSWTPILGAGELNLGDQITNLLTMPGDNVAGGAMACFARQRTYMLYGNSSADWQLVTQRYDTGALPHTAQFVDTCYVLDNRGVSSLQSTDAFGNFVSSSLTQLIRPWVMENKTRVLDSCVVRDKNQYRLLFSGGRTLTMTMQSNNVAGFTTGLLKHTMSIISTFDDTDGTELMFYGGDDGYVYQGESGTSHDGQDIETAINLAFNHSKSPRVLKQYRKLMFEVGGNGFAAFSYAADLAYGDVATPQIEPKAISFGDNSLGSASWDAASWDSAVWDGSNLLPAEQPIEGVAQNMSVKVFSSSSYSSPITLYGALVHFTPRRQMR